MRTVRSKRKANDPRHGVAVTELAVCLPMLVVLTVGLIETCSTIYLKQSLKIAAYEGARVALIPSATNQNVDAQCKLILQSRHISSAAVNISPNVSSAPAGTFVSVNVTAPTDGNGALPSFFFRGRTMSATVEMMKEQ